MWLLAILITVGIFILVGLWIGCALRWDFFEAIALVAVFWIIIFILLVVGIHNKLTG